MSFPPHLNRPLLPPPGMPPQFAGFPSGIFSLTPNEIHKVASVILITELLKKVFVKQSVHSIF